MFAQTPLIVSWRNEETQTTDNENIGLGMKCRVSLRINISWGQAIIFKVFPQILDSSSHKNILPRCNQWIDRHYGKPVSDKGFVVIKLKRKQIIKFFVTTKDSTQYSDDSVFFFDFLWLNEYKISWKIILLLFMLSLTHVGLQMLTWGLLIEPPNGKRWAATIYLNCLAATLKCYIVLFQCQPHTRNSLSFR